MRRLIILFAALFSLSSLAQTCPVNVSVATSPVYKITVAPLTPNAVTPITVTVSSAQNVAVTISPNILGPYITGPTDSTLTQTGTTLGLNLANANVWTAQQVFNGGLNGYVSGTGLVPTYPYVDLGAYGNPFENGYFNGLIFNSNVVGRHETTLQQSAALGYNVHNVLELPNASGTLALTSDVIPYVSPGSAGNVLTSNGSGWESAPLPVDTDTLATVTARGATTSVASSFTGGLSASAVSAGSLNVQTPTTSTIGAIIKGAAGQTADLQQWQDSAGAVKASVSAAGALAVPRLTFPTPSLAFPDGSGFGQHAVGIINVVIQGQRTAMFDSAAQISILRDTGKIWFGASQDTSLHRPSVGVLSINSGAGGLIVGGAGGNVPAISSGTAAPTTTPAKVGDIFVDITNKKLYFATGTSSSSDWTIAN